MNYLWNLCRVKFIPETFYVALAGLLLCFGCHSMLFLDVSKEECVGVWQLDGEESNWLKYAWTAEHLSGEARKKKREEFCEQAKNKRFILKEDGVVEFFNISIVDLERGMTESQGKILIGRWRLEEKKDPLYYRRLILEFDNEDRIEAPIIKLEDHIKVDFVWGDPDNLPSLTFVKKENNQ